MDNYNKWKELKLIKVKCSYIIICLSILITGIIYDSMRRRHLNIESCWIMTADTTDFSPYAFCIFQTQDEFYNYCDLYNQDHEYINQIDLDFSKNTYIITYGAPIREMYYSPITTIFCDPSPNYGMAWRKGKYFLMIEYYKPDNKIYLYEIAKNTNISEVIGM